MIPVHQPGLIVSEEDGSSVYPSALQINAWKAHKTVRYIIILLWFLSGLAVAWPIVIAQVNKSVLETALDEPDVPLYWTWAPSDTNALRLYMTPGYNEPSVSSTFFAYDAQLVLILLLVYLIQAIQTAGLH